MRMGHGSERRPIVESSRRQASRNASKGFARSALPSLPDGEKLWWMIAVPSRELLRRVPFVIGVMGLLAVGLVATLWLATRSTEDASTLSAMRGHNRELQQEQERLERDMERGQSVTELARRAGELGMVPARDVAKFVPQPDGSVQVVGDLKPAEGAPEVPLDGEPSKPGDPSKRQPPVPNNSGTSHEAAPPPAAPAPTELDDSVERVRPSQIAPDSPDQAPQAEAPEQTQPGSADPQVSSLPPVNPVSPLSQTANQASTAQPSDMFPGLPAAPAPQAGSPAPLDPAPPPLQAPDPVASLPNTPAQSQHMDQPEQESHE
ncbi:conserved hypothetical protein [Segniliparus rotundus DSM 44985]|uniref:FHA domain containing protein n=2 Tax=Segniliparus rotundus TaxID=286802 RepID=D6ZF29_SEGRD|nr:conserved hypothetical protein [Segniliparus rotundus DSM 44985]